MRNRRQHGHKDAAALLLDHGAAADKADNEGQTPLHVSALVSVNMLSLFDLYNLIVFEIATVSSQRGCSAADRSRCCC